MSWNDKDIPAWAKGAVGALNKLELVSGKGGNRFDPKATTTRAEAVTVLLN
ncbi:S-layer homology domain-containing protein [Cohnella abietis]|uniref:S-layer homology domain-containing protein n=1 Tax=Cohnella abietis TaxID=2507935 RepID=UPI00102E6D6E|nr:S-layer homology domain-containing protein [Cohnella abietis]